MSKRDVFGDGPFSDKLVLPEYNLRKVIIKTEFAEKQHEYELCRGTG